MTTNKLRLTLVTPERTLLEEDVRSITLPLYDGMAGVFPGRAPMIGRLGYGRLTIYGIDGSEESYFVDGGFVQVTQKGASVLTNRALTAGEIAPDEADESLKEAIDRKTRTEAEAEAREKDQRRYRAMASFARSPK
jgi:F-type H+-transporting ATPase subunit epsilon